MVIPSSGGKLKNLYILGKKYYDYSKARPAFNDKFTSFFPFDEDEYERRKQDAINTYFESGAKDTTLSKRARDKYIYYIKENLPGLTHDDIARIGKISVKTVQRAINLERPK